jgi:hypothetical protein
MSEPTRWKLDRIVGDGYKDIQLYFEGYAEPGYSDPECGIIALANWNHYEREARLLEALGVEIEWSDEWAMCDDCNKLVRTSPDSYCWMRSYWMDDDCYIQCEECIDKDPEAYIEWCEGDPLKAITIQLDLEEHGYKMLEGDFQRGFHEHQDDDPREIAKSLEEKGVDRYVFTLDSVGQFDADFSIWVHKSQFDKITNWDEAKKKSDESPASAMKRGLKAASEQMGKLEGEGIRYSKINEDGTAETRLVSREEFIEGIRDD